jgi:hypothetical protein
VPIRDTAAAALSLRNDYGASHGPHSPASFQVCLFIGDPSLDGVEVSATTTLINEDDGSESQVPNGYARATIANDGASFPQPDTDTGVLTTATVTFPTSTDEYPDTVTHWLLLDSAGNGWDSGSLPRDEQIAVEEAGVTPALSLAIFYSTADLGTP